MDFGRTAKAQGATPLVAIGPSSGVGVGHNARVKVSAKADYAVRAAAELAAAEASGQPVRAEAIATAQGIPQRFLENILSDMRHAGLVQSQRGAEGGHRLAKPAASITVADVIRAVDGPLAAVRGERPEPVTYEGPAVALQRVWIAVRKNLRVVVERVTLADLANGNLPDDINALAEDPEAWTTR
jgi:Rrf2 family protein